MAARDQAGFAGLLRDERMLRGHGFDAWPDVDELTRYACGLEDAVQVLAGQLGCRLERDVRGRWALVGNDEGPVT